MSAPAGGPLALAAETVAALAAHAREAYPDECCGAILRRDGREVVRRIRNSQDEEHARDPERFPRTARTAYHMDSRDLLALFREVEERGWELAAFYHSHPDRGAYFSEEDRQRAVYRDRDAGGEGGGEKPVYPGATYLVVGLEGDRVRELRAFRWDEAARDFVETPVLPAAMG